MKLTISYFILPVFLFCLLFQSCKKDETTPTSNTEEEHPLNVAPCVVEEFTNGVNEFNLGGSSFFPDAQSHVYFQDIEFAFNHATPPTGMYTLCHKDYPTPDSIIENQIMFAHPSGSFMHISNFSIDSLGYYSSEVYVENNESELIISFCQFQDTMVFFDNFNYVYVGNSIKNSLYRNCY